MTTSYYYNGQSFGSFSEAANSALYDMDDQEPAYVEGLFPPYDKQAIGRGTLWRLIDPIAWRCYLADVIEECEE